MSIPILYSAYTSSCSFRVRIALNIKKIKYKYIEMNLYDKNNELLKPYRKTNPNMKVPCLNIDGMDISESKVICDYLDKLYPDPPLYPTNILAYIRTNEVCEYINASIQPLQNTPVLNKIKDSMDHMEWARFFIRKGLTAVCERIKDHRGKYTIGDQITMADVFLYPQLYNTRRRFNIDIDKEFPELAEVERALDLQEEFTNALPDKIILKATQSIPSSPPFQPENAKEQKSDVKLAKL